MKGYVNIYNIISQIISIYKINCILHYRQDILSLYITWYYINMIYDPAGEQTDPTIK